MSDAKIAIAFTLVHEGGFQKMEDDPGDWTGGAKGVGELKGTKFGISAHEFPDLDIENLTEEQAIQSYMTGRPPAVRPYWNTHYSDFAYQPLANKVFDTGVLFGAGTAVKILQTVLRVTVDGIIGPYTVEQANKLDDFTLTQAFATGLVAHAVGVANGNPAERKYLGDWIRRVNCPDCGFKH